MILAKVVGTVVATRKDERLVGSTLLLVQPVSPLASRAAHNWWRSTPWPPAPARPC